MPRGFKSTVICEKCSNGISDSDFATQKLNFKSLNEKRLKKRAAWVNDKQLKWIFANLFDENGCPVRFCMTHFMQFCDISNRIYYRLKKVALQKKELGGGIVAAYRKAIFRNETMTGWLALEIKYPVILESLKTFMNQRITVKEGVSSIQGHKTAVYNEFCVFLRQELTKVMSEIPFAFYIDTFTRLCKTHYPDLVFVKAVRKKSD